jgi:hypothetical protein
MTSQGVGAGASSRAARSEYKRTRGTKQSVEERWARERKEVIMALAIRKPTPWNGEPVYHRFGRWADQVDEWRRNHDVSEFAVIATMGFLLGGATKD